MFGFFFGIADRRNTNFVSALQTSVDMSSSLIDSDLAGTHYAVDQRFRHAFKL